MEHLIVLDSITKKYPTAVALNNITLNLPKTGMIFIKGKSGCGKTTLLNLLGGLDMPTQGEILFDGKSTANFSPKEWDEYRNRFIGFVFQDYNLFDNSTVEDNILLALDIQDELKNTDKKKERVREVLDFVGLQGYEMRKTSELSGGQKQRVAIARAIAKQSKLLLADEPTGNLDTESSKLVHSLLKKISAQRLVIIVTHDIASAIEYGDRIITISDGKVIEDIELDKTDCSQKRYSIDVMDECGSKVFTLESELRNTAKELLSSWLLAQHETKQFSFNIREEKNSLDMQQNCSISQVMEVNAKGLSLSRRFSMASANLSPQKVRLAFTTIMFFLTIFILLIVSFVLTYDRTETIGHYLKRQNTTEVYLMERKSYENLFFEEQENYICKGKRFFNKIEKNFPELKIIPRLQVELTMLDTSNESFKIADEVTLLVTDNYEEVHHELDSGRYPINRNEIVITDYIAQYIFKEKNVLNKTIRIDNRGAFKVVGILKTDCIEKQIALKVKRNALNSFEQFDLQNIYQIAITGTDYYNTMKSTQSCLQLPKSDFFKSDMETQYLQSTLSFGAQSTVTGDLLYGNMPRSKNEVLISSEMAMIYQIDQNNLGQHFSFIDIYAEKYNDTYSDSLNMYDYFCDDVIVVGVYDNNSLSTEYLADVLICDELYNKIVDDNLQYYNLKDYLLITGSNNLMELTKKADANNFIFQEPAIANIYHFQQTLESVFGIIVLFFIVIILITFIMLNTYISNNIKVNTKRIGVLKALGVTTLEIKSIFLIEVIIISIISYMFSLLLTIIFINYVNTQFITQIPGHEFEYLYWNWEMSVVVAIFSIGLSICSAIYPIIKLARKKPVEIIQKNNF